jgi:hypothetical protein
MSTSQRGLDIPKSLASTANGVDKSNMPKVTPTPKPVIASYPY